MELAELVYDGKGGLGELVAHLADAIEIVLTRHGRDWSPAYPITLREALGMGLQQQMLGGHPQPRDPGHGRGFHVWIALPAGGSAVFAQELAWRLLQGCTHPSGSPRLIHDLEAVLLAGLGPCLRNAEDLPGLSTNHI